MEARPRFAIRLMSFISRAETSNPPCTNQKKLMDQLPPSFRPRLENQVAVVTGGTRGIGAGIVRRFVEEGAQIVFSGRSAEKGNALEEELGENVAFYRADAASASETEALMNFAVEHFGSLDCVVNNAGVVGEGGPIAQTSVEGFERSIALLLFGTFFGIKYSVPHMKTGSISLHRIDQLRERFQSAALQTKVSS
jgi:NAD(P)-dependent dehydrogenase (short-subunit alcohol dehydrogenase family)